MIHDVSSGKAGKSEDLKVSSQETDRLKQLVFTKMAKFCGHENRNYFLDLLSAKNNTDIYLTPLQAKKHKLIDHIGIPEMQVSVNISMDFIP
jgi:ATP-dependent protease ClpP protease subunit